MCFPPFTGQNESLKISVISVIYWNFLFGGTSLRSSNSSCTIVEEKLIKWKTRSERYAERYRARDAHEAFFRPKANKPAHRIHTPKKKPTKRSLITKERAVMARAHWERHHGDHQDLYDSHLDLDFSPVIHVHHHQHDDSDTITSTVSEAAAAPIPSYTDTDRTLFLTPAKITNPKQ